MTPDELGIEGLAEYLHLDPAQVARLADRGKLPGRKVGGHWRFARSEINQWLERRIGASNEDQLLQMEDMLSRNPGAAAEPDISIAELLPVEAIAVPLAAKTRGSVITAMCEVAAQTGWLWEPDKMAEAVRAREDLLSTALDNGVALLHPRRPLPNLLGQAFLALGVSGHGIPFGGPRGTLTDIFFLICSLEDRGHLRVLARLSRLINSPMLLADLRRATDAGTARELIMDFERQMTD
jgi:PTS system nitrogen regulatory IIA component